jgi:hypothetical protein
MTPMGQADQRGHPDGTEDAGHAVAAARRRLALRLATIVVVAGCGALILATLALSIARPAFSALQGAPPESSAAWRMQRIGLALVAHAARHDGRFPDRLSTLYDEGILPSLEWFEHPETPGAVTSREAIDGAAAFPYLIAPGTRISTTPIPALREFRDGGVILLVSKRGVAWRAPSTDAAPAP